MSSPTANAAEQQLTPEQWAQRYQQQNQQASAEITRLRAALASAEAATAAACAVGAAQQQAQAFASRAAGIKPPPLDKFSGVMGYEVDTWLRNIERQFALAGGEAAYPLLPPTQRLAVAVAYLGGAAEAWWENLDQHSKAAASSSWDAFKETLRTRFRPVQAAELARARLRSLKQRGPVAGYINLFHKELAPVQHEMHANDQIFYFREGLLDRRVQDKVLEAKPTSLQTAMEEAIRWEAQYARGRATAAAPFHMRTSHGPSDSSSASSGVVPMEVSALSEMETVGDEHPYSTRDGEPRAAGSSDHHLLSKVEKLERLLESMNAREDASASRHRLAAMQSSRVSGLKPGEIDRRKREGLCFRCGKKDHMKRDCPERAPSTPSFKSSN
jgi:hypothetical protein